MPRHAPHLSLAYKLFFLYIEPLSALIGAWFAYYRPSTYLYLTYPTPSSNTSDPTIATTTALSQLANLYLLFALNEALVLRSAYTAGRAGGYNLNVWRTLLFGLLVADAGHLWSVRDTGSFADVYVHWWGWNRMGWGNVGFVYLGMCMRVCFLCGVGLGAG